MDTKLGFEYRGQVSVTRWYISGRTRTNRYRNTFLPISVRLLNAKSGRRKLLGRMGDTMGLTTIISIVTTNVVVLCCVL